jgi:gamma-glutamylcyclotransferase (GGCT)/AIG2-like uncharacterized protein YtfP
MTDNLVFVYGTLKRGGRIRALDKVQGSEFLGETLTKDRFHMIDLGAYPGVVDADPEQGTQIAGELFRVTSDLMHQLDQVEGYPAFYNRRQIETNLGTAWIYYLPSHYKNNINVVAAEHSDQIVMAAGVASWIPN